MATETEFWGRDAASNQAKVDAARARVVQEALLEIARDMSGTGRFAIAAAFDTASDAPDATLIKLGRLIK